MNDAGLSFLTTIWGSENLAPMWGELRVAEGDARKFKKYFFNSAHMLVTDAEIHDAKGNDCYFGVLPRTKMSSGKDSTVEATRWLWADIDTKHQTRLQAIESINKLELLPTMLVDSGNGFHAYWKLKQPLAIEDAATVMKGMAYALAGDRVQNAGRILRIPGTHNWKHNSTDAVHPPEVRLLWDTGKEYRLGLFERFLPPLLPLPPKDAVKHLKPFKGNLDEAAVKGTRSEKDYQTVLQMLEAGWLDEEIRAAFQQHPHGVGTKYAEKGKQGDKYLDLTIANARKYLGLV